MSRRFGIGCFVQKDRCFSTLYLLQAHNLSALAVGDKPLPYGVEMRKKNNKRLVENYSERNVKISFSTHSRQKSLRISCR